ncbi:MAG: tripartite tricarboxylate transporter substrate binding protein [Rhodobacteraceae bacterium]|nr:tripartite tricarboxylate transporter substrate binding protein [Paracoccaceae bacterium]
MNMIKKICITTGLSLALATPAMAFPDKPIELVVPFKPGGGSDVSARVFAKCVGPYLSEKVLIKNITGARGKIAEVEVRDSRADGYKLLWAHQGMDMGLATGRSDYNYTAFKPVAASVDMNFGIFASGKSGIDSVKSLLSKSKENPGKYTIGAALNGFSHFAALDFLNSAGIDSTLIRVIPMSGGKKRIVAAIQGNLTLVPTAVGAAAPYVDSGDMLPVAVLSAERDTRLGDVMTSVEQGVESTFAMNFTTFAPKDTPDDVISTLADAWGAAAKDPACIKMLAAQSMKPGGARGAELNKNLADRYALIEKLANKFNLTSKKK